MHDARHEEDLRGYALADPDATSRREELVHRLAECSSCIEYAYELLDTLRAVRGDEGPVAPERYTALLEDGMLRAAQLDAAQWSTTPAEAPAPQRQTSWWERARDAWQAWWDALPTGPALAGVAAAAAGVAAIMWFMRGDGTPPRFRMGVATVSNDTLSDTKVLEATSDRLQVTLEDAVLLTLPAPEDHTVATVLIVELSGQSDTAWLEANVAAGTTATLRDPNDRPRGTAARAGAHIEIRFSAAVFVARAEVATIAALACDQPGSAAERAAAAQAAHNSSEPGGVPGCSTSQQLALERRP